MGAPVRLLILLDLLAGTAMAALAVLAVGLPLAARGALDARALTALTIGGLVAGMALAGVLLARAVARPVDRLLGAAALLGAGDQHGAFPILQPPGDVEGHGLPRAAIAFERLAGALVEERRRLATKVAELESSNAQLAATRESLLRSEKLATVGQLAAGVAHEVGNPLGAIGGYAELARARLAARGGDVELVDWLERICAETQRIDRTVRELLDFARPARPVLAPVALPVALDAAQRLARVQPRFRDVEVALDLPSALPAVRGDEGRLCQLFLNLLLNAGDAMGARGELRIAARVCEGAVEVELADRGPGIPEADLARVFDPFFTTKPPGEGTGLGLSICHVIVESFGGTITAGNRQGGGAVFTVRLPTAVD
jgi:C4-dicarboxylate-specific signal transduction histidine kinase